MCPPGKFFSQSDRSTGNGERVRNLLRGRESLGKRSAAESDVTLRRSPYPASHRKHGNGAGGLWTAGRKRWTQNISCPLFGFSRFRGAALNQ
jgi:hypothetical protein